MTSPLSSVSSSGICDLNDADHTVSTQRPRSRGSSVEPQQSTRTTRSPTLVPTKRTRTHSCLNANCKFRFLQLFARSLSRASLIRHLLTFRCKPGKIVCRVPGDSSTSNLKVHNIKCKAEKNMMLAEVGIKGTGDIAPGEVRQQFAVWCAESARPFVATADRQVRRIGGGIHPFRH